MAKFKFRMQNFLSLRERIEEQKKLDYGRAVAKREHEKQVKAALILRRESYITTFREQIKGEVINPIEVQSYNDYIDWLKHKIIEQEKVVILAEKFAESKRLELVEAMKERKMLEKLKEKDAEVFRIEEKLTEQKLVDEIVSYRYNKGVIN